VIASSPKLEVYAPEEGQTLVLKSKKYQKQVTVESIREHQGACIIKFQNLESMEDVYRLIGYDVFLEAEEIETEGDIVEFTVKDISGSVWGVVRNIETSGLSQVLEVEDADGDVIYVPYAEPIIKEIDVRQRLILIDAPAGLRDLNKTE